MPDRLSTTLARRATPRGFVDRRWLLAVGGLLLLILSHPLLWQAQRKELWFAPAGVALVLTAWLGWRVVPAVALVLIAIPFASQPPGLSVALTLTDGALTAAALALGWWYYHDQANGARRLDDPKSATLYLLLIPCAVAGLIAVVLANFRVVGWTVDFSNRVIYLWISHALALLALVPMLLVVATPWLVYYEWATPDAAERRHVVHPRLGWTMGEVLETVGLATGAGVLGMALAVLHAREASTNWHLWGVLLLVIVWASLRVGLRGGSVVAGSATVLALQLGSLLAVDDSLMTTLRGNLLAQCSTALLIGASADWIRSSEARYRQVVGHIPVMLYSARFLHKPTPAVMPEVEILLVSPASRRILGCEPEALVGSYQSWLDRIHRDDRELVQAALAQLLLQKQPVTCEYRLAAPTTPAPAPPADADTQQAKPNPLLNLGRSAAQEHRWLRDTLAPFYGPDEQLDGWEGVVEDITEQRNLAHDLRRTSNMLHALVAHLPTGIFFVHGVHGQPLLVNARARQLLGQREDLAAGLSNLSTVYRLYKPDGTPYPWNELPVYKALRNGTSSMRDDIVVHRPDGRRIPLVTWAAPVNLGTQGEADAAVWVLEDLTALRQAEAARQESELRLRGVVETMAEGLIVQNQSGAVVECNPAACVILGVSAEELRSWSSLAPGGQCFQESGSPLPRDEQPDRVTMQTGRPVRGMVIGIRTAESGTGAGPAPVRWILANAMPIAIPEKAGDGRGQRVVTTFSDITAHRAALQVLRQSEEQYRGLVESMPLMLLQFDADGTLVYLNPAAEEITGYSGEQLRAEGFWRDRIHADDWPCFAALLDGSRQEEQARLEFRYRAADGCEKTGYALAQPRPRGGTTLLVVDMTQRRRMEQELETVQRLELVARIANGVVHDFNNLLTVILSYTQLVKDAVGDHPAAADLQRISQAGEQATRLAGQLLAFSKQRTVVRRRVELNSITAHTLEMLRPTLPFSIHVELRQQAEPLWLMADDSPLQQVVMNLCLNARDAMPKGGQLLIETALVQLPPGENWVRLVVQDSGMGMDENLKARMFEPLFTTKERGSGLGLAVVKQLVEGFGGHIHVNSAAGQGARFEVWLPSPRA